MIRFGLLLAVLQGSPPGADWDARALFERFTSDGVRLSADGASIELDRGELFEDDGPAAGFSYKPNEEIVPEGACIRKTLIIPDPRAAKATLLLASSKPWRVSINGTPAALEPAEGAGKEWRAYAFDPRQLRAGENEIVLHGPGRIWIARNDEFPAGAPIPNRSARSGDGGRTWDDARLGPKGDIDGEYGVRIFLDRPRASGFLESPVLDVGNLPGRAWGAPLVSPGPVRFRVDGTAAIEVRSGTTFVPDAAWSSWEQSDRLEKPAGRYVQVRLCLATTDPLKSPAIRRLTIEAAPGRPDDWTRGLKLIEARNDEIVRTSIPFAYEPFDHPKLKALRDRYRLDEVVKGAPSEFDLILRLAAWSSGRWQKMHLSESYPAWDALEILAPHADGTPVGGFCQQYNVVFLQACESFGLVGRAVSISQGGLGDRPKGSGHEVVEIWSNEHRRWVYVDGNTAWYATDRETGVPLSLWELRRRQIRAVRNETYTPVRIVEIAKTRHSWPGLTEWPPFGELRLIPRSNFLAEKEPLPRNQGMRGWFWTGHCVWTDDEVPAGLLYGRRVTRRGNFEWTPNQAHMVLEALAPGEFRVHLDTVTPGFETFLADLDGAGKKPVASGFSWKLRPGRNALEVRSRNLAGREGPPSRVVLEAP